MTVDVTRLTQAEFRELGEYSCSLPTGTTIGKRWKCNTNAFTACLRDKPPRWLMGEYYDLGPPDNAKEIGIRWTKIEVIPQCERHPNTDALKQGRKGDDYGKWFCPLCGKVLS